jgi:hypothetical protein
MELGARQQWIHPANSLVSIRPRTSWRWAIQPMRMMGTEATADGAAGGARIR